MSPTALPLETKLFLELTRGAALAVHAAAGSARGHRAARLLRAAEGLCRSAAALLQTPDDAKTSQGKAKEGPKDSTPKKKEKPKQQQKDADLDKATAQKKPGAKRRRPRRRAAPAAELPPAEDEDVDFDDHWADEAKPPAHQKRTAALANLPANYTTAAAKTRPQSQPTPPGATGDAAAAPSGPKPALLAGDLAEVHGLVGRPELNGELLRLERHDRPADRWECETGEGEWLRLRPANLRPLRAADGD